MPLYFDNTRLKAFKTCPRFYYLRHERDLLKEAVLSPPLLFGSAWHSAQDVIWELAKSPLSTDDLAKQAFLGFIKKWTEEGGKFPEDYSLEELESLSPRTPQVALEMIYSYIEQRREFIAAGEVLAVEQPFAVPLFEDGSVYYIGRLDKVFRHPREGKIIVEHKTTTWYAKATGFRNEWLDSWSPDSQIDGYTYSGNMLYDGEIKGVWIDAALIHKTVHDKFKFIPIDRRKEMLNSWLVEAREWVETIKIAQERKVWAKNTESCMLYGRPCLFRDICRFKNDPFSAETPEEFIIQHWDPFDILNIKELGMPEEKKHE